MTAMRAFVLLALAVGCQAFSSSPLGLQGRTSRVFKARNGVHGLCAQRKMMDLSTIPDPYQVLGVRKEATPAEIKTAYRKQAAVCHPDVNPAPEAQELFINLNNAMEIVGDEDMRRRYDMGGRAGLPADFAERVELTRKQGGTGYVKAMENVEKAMSDDKLAILLNVVPAVIFLTAMSLYPDVIRDAILGGPQQSLSEQLAEAAQLAEAQQGTTP